MGFGTKYFSFEKLKNMYPAYKILSLNQTHSSRIFFNKGGKGDGIISTEKGVILVIKTADCLPVLIKDREEKMVAAIHAGWRGLCKGILLKAINRIKELGFSPDDLEVAFGPSIGPCCYEVGSEVEECFIQTSLPFKISEKKLNLPYTAMEHLIFSGVNLKNIHSLPICTKCTPELFFSYRKGQEGRMYSFIGLIKENTEVKFNYEKKRKI